MLDEEVLGHQESPSYSETAKGKGDNAETKHRTEVMT